jgi:hypothetical protein
MANIAGTILLSCRRLFLSRHWLKHCKTIIISGMSGCFLYAFPLVGKNRIVLNRSILANFWPWYWYLTQICEIEGGVRNWQASE